jgi:hypothetical protein
LWSKANPAGLLEFDCIVLDSGYSRWNPANLLKFNCTVLNFSQLCRNLVKVVEILPISDGISSCIDDFSPSVFFPTNQTLKNTFREIIFSKKWFRWKYFTTENILCQNKWSINLSLHYYQRLLFRFLFWDCLFFFFFFKSLLESQGIQAGNDLGKEIQVLRCLNRIFKQLKIQIPSARTPRNPRSSLLNYLVIWSLISNWMTIYFNSVYNYKARDLLINMWELHIIFLIKLLKIMYMTVLETELKKILPSQFRENKVGIQKKKKNILFFLE